MKPLILFPNSPLNPREVEPDFVSQYDAAKSAGCFTGVIDFRISNGQFVGSVRLLGGEDQSNGTAIYRGWMLRPNEYEVLFAYLKERGITLINSPQAYETCHYLPTSYPFIERNTPRTAFQPCNVSISREEIEAIVSEFGDSPLIVKDYVKSQKHMWNDACFIPRASDLDKVEAVTRCFLEFQDDDLNVGLVYREFIHLKQIGQHPKSGAPLHLEYRVFFLDGNPVAVGHYWEDSAYPDESPPLNQFIEIAKDIPSRFFTMDIAQTEAGEWIIIELGDGQVSGLPGNIMAASFYSSLVDAMHFNA